MKESTSARVNYELFLDDLDKLWAECLRILYLGGRVAGVVGDVGCHEDEPGRHHMLDRKGSSSSHGGNW